MLLACLCVLGSKAQMVLTLDSEDNELLETDSKEFEQAVKDALKERETFWYEGSMTVITEDLAKARNETESKFIAAHNMTQEEMQNHENYTAYNASMTAETEE